MKQRAVRKVQIAINKMVDLLDVIENPGKVVRVLEALRDLEVSIDFGKTKNGKIKI